VPTLDPHDVDGSRCDTFGFWRKHLRNVTQAFNSKYGPRYSCMHAALTLQKMGLSVMLSPRSIMYAEGGEGQYDLNSVQQAPPRSFYESHRWVECQHADADAASTL
jgi:hypothetical protein